MKLRYTPAAIDDMESIRDYIADKLMNPDAALGIISRIAASCDKLKERPYIGLSLRRKTGREIEGYCLICGAYMIVYEVDEAISVLRILDTRVDYMRILFGES